MASDQDWRLWAEGIPVRVNGQVCRVRARGVYTVRMILSGGGGLTLWEYGDEAPTMDPREFFPNLADPDERAAYDRRLALALGAPVEAVEEGVRFRRVHGTCWEVSAGQWGRTFTLDDLDDPFPADPLLARALAWPADKRVTG